MKFDTLDKKPKLYNIAIASAATVLIIVLLYFIKPQNLISISAIVIDLYLVVVIFFLVRAFFLQLRYNPYSYNTIYYSGFSLYLLTFLVTVIIFTVNTFTDPEFFTAGAFVMLLADAPKTFMILSSPVVLFLSVMLFISNISLLRHEGRRLSNFLGIILAVIMVAAEAVLFFVDYSVMGSFGQVLVHGILVSVGSSLYLYFECMVIGSCIANLIAIKHRPDPDKDFILILGCAIRKDGTPTPVLAGRIERAMAFWKEQLEKTGKEAVFVTSGGQGSDEVVSESAAMKQYLLDHGIREELILEEDQSTSTLENMKFSKNIIEEQKQEYKVIYSTTNYHVFRSGIMARRVKMKAQGIGAKTKWYFWPNALVREFVSMLVQHRGKQILIILSMIVIYVLLFVIGMNALV